MYQDSPISKVEFDFSLTSARDIEHARMHDTFIRSKQLRFDMTSKNIEESRDHKNPFSTQVKLNPVSVNTSTVRIPSKRKAEMDHPFKLTNPELLVASAKSKQIEYNEQY